MVRAEHADATRRRPGGLRAAAGAGRRPRSAWWRAACAAVLVPRWAGSPRRAGARSRRGHPAPRATAAGRRPGAAPRAAAGRRDVQGRGSRGESAALGARRPGRRRDQGARAKLVVGVDQNSYRWGYRDPATGKLRASTSTSSRAIAEDILGDRTPRSSTRPSRPISASPRCSSGTVDMVVRTMTINCDRIKDRSPSPPPTSRPASRCWSPRDSSDHRLRRDPARQAGLHGGRVRPARPS